MLLSAVSVLVVAQSSSEIPEGLMDNPVYNYIEVYVLRLLFWHHLLLVMFVIYVFNHFISHVNEICDGFLCFTFCNVNHNDVPLHNATLR